MKRSLILTTMAIGLLLMSGSAFAQLSINKGIKGGLNFATLRGDGDFTSKSGIMGGFYLEIDPIGPLAVQAEAVYSQKGAKFDAGTDEVTVKINYLEIPLMVKIGIPLGPMVSYQVMAGPALGFRISDSVDPAEAGPEEGNIAKSSDLGLALGFGLKVAALISEVTVDFRYTLGLSAVNEDPDISDVKNGVVSVVVGLGI